MRISDWSSDVCSSDLLERLGVLDENARPGGNAGARHDSRGGGKAEGAGARNHHDRHRIEDGDLDSGASNDPADKGDGGDAENDRHKHGADLVDQPLDRSEEHTSELQSLMRISYAVFCLKKK